MTHFAVDESWHRPHDRHLVVAGSPVRMFRLTDAGVRIADALEQNTPLPAGHESLTSRLLDAGAIHPVASDQVEPSRVTVVVPTYATSALQLERLERLAASLPAHKVVIVDDASPMQVPSDLAGAIVIRRDTNGGPGAARNTGLSEVTTEFVAFVDDDVTVSSEALCRAAAVCTGTTALCAPRVSATPPTHAANNVISRYESARSPLDMGEKSARVTPLSRVSYVPAAVLVLDASTCRDNRGFDESLRVGEDVDFVWRLATKHHCRYEPAIVVHHESRSTLRDFLAQRRKYGSSAASLATRHGSLVAPYASNLLLFVFTASASLSLFVVSALCAVTHVGYVSSSLRRAGDDTAHSVRLSITAMVHALRVFADAMIRTWLPLFVVLALVFPTTWWTISAAAIVPALVEWWARKPMNPLSYVVLRTLDSVAYCTGVWIGVWREKSMRCLAPQITLSRRRAA